jgi:superfamily I DNA/RNA helicase
MKMRTAVFGPPGTGKTQYLAEHVARFREDELQDTAVLSFSRSGAKELTGRVKGTKYTGTIHALCFKELGLGRGQVAQMDEYTDWVGGYEEDVRLALQLGGLATRTGKSLEECIHDFSQSVEMPQESVIHFYWESYLNWKKDYAYLDFDDMIERAIGRIPRFGHVIVDEAQDLTPQQWRLIRWIAPDELVVAGDDDQSIYTWAGANPTGMLELEAKELVLSQSFRVPFRVHRWAEATVQHISYRKPKQYDPVKYPGYVTFNSDMGFLLNPPIPYLFMCRDRYIQEDVEETFINWGLPYRYVSPHRTGWFENSWANAVRCVQEKNLEGLLHRKKRLTPYGKQEAEEGRVPENWRQAVDVPQDMINYFEQVDLMAEPMITLSTIHAQKGREADHVVLHSQCSTKTEELQDATATMDDEIRVWYVGLTRARKGVTILDYGNNPYITAPAFGGQPHNDRH